MFKDVCYVSSFMFSVVVSCIFSAFVTSFTDLLDRDFEVFFVPQIKKKKKKIENLRFYSTM